MKQKLGPELFTHLNFYEEARIIYDLTTDVGFKMRLHFQEYD